MRRLVVLAGPVLRHLVIVDALLNLSAGDRHDALQEPREVLVFQAVRFVVHGIIIAQTDLTKHVAPWRALGGLQLYVDHKCSIISSVLM